MIYYSDKNTAITRCRLINQRKKILSAIVEGPDGLGYYIMPAHEARNLEMPYTIYS